MSASGAILMSIFGAIWWVVGAHTTGRVAFTFYAIPAVISLALIAAALRAPAAEAPADLSESSRRARLVGIWSAVEGVVILIAVIVLRNIGMDAYVATAIAAIVGLHFIPLARSLPARRFYITSLAFCAIAVGSIWIPDADQRLWLVSAASAAVLWLTSATVV
jgi:hypothetical protein